MLEVFLLPGKQAGSCNEVPLCKWPQKRRYFHSPLTDVAASTKFCELLLIVQE